MKYSDVLEACMLVIESNDVPLIIGESGIGKTALAREIAEKTNHKLITLDANLLKEGEIGGLPVVDRGRTIYATHNKLLQVENYVQRGYKVLLFIDELNRCEHAVQQELMNLILNREINGYELGKDVKIIAAMNPSNKYDNFLDSSYEVVDMDPAQEDRFVWLEMESDVKEWIKWAMQSKSIHEDIIEFISSFPDYLHRPYSNESVKPTPRSYERVSKSYTIYKNSNGKIYFDTLLSVVKGNIGVSISTDFANFIKENRKPLINPKDVFKLDSLPVDLKERILKESNSRLYILGRRAINYINDLEEYKNEFNIFGEILKLYPRDLRLGIMKEIKEDCPKEIYEKLLDSDEFIDAFFDIYV